MSKDSRGGSRGSGGGGSLANPLTNFRPESAQEKAYNDKQFAALNAQLQNKYGFGLDQSLRDRVDFKGVRDSIYGVESVLREFPGASQYLRGGMLQAGDSDPDAYAFASSMTNSVTLGSALYMNYRTVGVLMDNDVSAKWHPAGSTAASVAQHETGHLISYAAARKMGYSLIDQSTKNAAMKTIVEKAMKTKAVENWMKKNGLKAEGARRSISGYAAVSYRNGAPNYNETIAEAVSDYMSNRSRANVFSRAIVRELKTILK